MDDDKTGPGRHSKGLKEHVSDHICGAFTIYVRAIYELQVRVMFQILGSVTGQTLIRVHVRK